jgi:muramoyltetrapeptide carboxypeptidase
MTAVNRPKCPLRPLALKAGDRVGVFAPSFPTATWFPARFEHAVCGLRDTLGVEPIVDPQALINTGYTSGTIDARAAALQRFLSDPEIRAIFATIGGFNSNELLERLDPSTFAKSPKILIGYSDVTALLLGLQAMTGWITFYGPTLMTQFGEYPTPHHFTVENLRRVIMSSTPAGALPDPDGWTNEFLDWGTTAWRQRPREMSSPAKRVVWRTGQGVGQLFGGNIETINALVGTPHLAIPDEVVFFWEATEEEAYLPRVQRALTQLRQIGLFDRARAMLIGRSPNSQPVRQTTLRDVVLEATQGHTFPIVADLAFGHTDPMVTLPIGTVAAVTADSAGATVRLLEAGVA